MLVATFLDMGATVARRSDGPAAGSVAPLAGPMEGDPVAAGRCRYYLVLALPMHGGGSGHGRGHRHGSRGGRQ